MPTLVIRTIIIYLFLIIAMRIGGKRQIGQMQLSELITALVLSELAISPISHEDTPLLFGIAPIFIVTSLEIICAFLSTKSNAAKRFFDGVPSVIVKRGELDIRELAKNRMGIEEFISETREQGIRDISDIDYAIIEADGRLSVFEKDIKIILGQRDGFQLPELAVGIFLADIQHPVVQQQRWGIFRATVRAIVFALQIADLFR